MKQEMDWQVGWDVAQCCLAFTKAWVASPALQKTFLVAHMGNPSMWEVEEDQEFKSPLAT